jgi:predicted acetyltransferase
MSNVVIRQLHIDETVNITRRLGAYAFRNTPPLPEATTWQSERVHLQNAAHFAVFEDGKAVASSVIYPMAQNIRGQIYAAGGIASVATHPAGRRKGYARKMLTHLFKYHNEQGHVVSLLYPFRESFYTRLGYTTFTQPKMVRFAPVALQPLLKQELDGEVELVEIADGFEAYQSFVQKLQPKIHGLGRFTPPLASSIAKKNAYWLAIARVQGEIKAMMLYQITAYAEDMKVEHFWYDGAQGRYLLLEWFARHIDQIKEVELTLPPFEHPETWWPDLKIRVTAIDPPLARIINIDRLTGLQTGSGCFTARIRDEYCPWNEGTYQFESVDGKLHISEHTTADCELSIQALTALIYGTHEPETFEFRTWGNPSAEIQTAMQTMFPAMQPYLHEEF